MKIKIECNPDVNEPEKTVFEYLKQKLDEALRTYTLEIEDTEYKFERR